MDNSLRVQFEKEMTIKVITESHHNTIELIKYYDEERKKLYASVTPEIKNIIDKYMEFEYRIFSLDKLLRNQEQILEISKKKITDSPITVEESVLKKQKTK